MVILFLGANNHSDLAQRHFMKLAGSGVGYDDQVAIVCWPVQNEALVSRDSATLMGHLKNAGYC